MRLALLFGLMIASLPARADLFDWIDKDGVEHFSSEPPPGDAAPKGPVKRQKALPAGASAPAGAPAADPKSPNAKPAPKITLYTTSWCPVCKAAKAYLKARGLAYQEFDVETDPKAAAQYHAYGGHGVPLALIDGATVTGFSAATYDQRLPR
jgi:glutaredoxin